VTATSTTAASGADIDALTTAAVPSPVDQSLARGTSTRSTKSVNGRAWLCYGEVRGVTMSRMILTWCALFALAACALDPELDSDGDGLPDVLEEELGTDPDLADSDSDGYTDFEEHDAGTDPLDSASVIYAGGWPYNPDKDAIEDPGWDSEAAEGRVLPRYLALDQYGDEVDLYDFAGHDRQIVLDIGTWFCEPCKVLAAWLADGDLSELEELGWWNEDFEPLREEVQSGDLYWITVLWSGGVPVTAQDVTEWHNTWPNHHIPVLADAELDLQSYLQVQAMPNISVVDSDMSLVVWGLSGPQPGLRYLADNL
jgi:hypothetical protein